MRRFLLALACVLATVAAVLAATGGAQISLAAIRLSARSPRAAIVGAVVSAAAWLVLAVRTRRLASDARDLDRWISVQAPRLAVLVAVLSAAASLAFQTFSASGADASGYFSLAALFLDRRLTYHEPFAALADWPRAAESVAPLGWWVTGDPAVQVPTYALGLPLLMAPLHAIGGPIGASLIGPLALGVIVVAVARLAGVLAGGAAALLAAVWIATSPVALMAAVQPMSDLPAAAAWLVCWMVLAPPPRGGADRSLTGARAMGAGIAAAFAVLIRPNLAPLAGLPLVYVIGHRPPPIEGSRAASVRSTLCFAAPVAIAGVVVGAAQWRWYGSPWRSGYGTAEELYALANAGPNIRLYTAWLFETHGPWLMAAPLVLVSVRHRLSRWLLAFAAATGAAYLVYAVFEVWTYLRFMLPAIAAAVVALAAFVASALQRMPAAARGAAFLGVLAAVGVFQLRSARAHEVFTLREQHARAPLAGHYLDGRLPDLSVIIAGEQSGAMRYYTGHSVLRWDVLSLESFVRAAERAAEAGYEVWIALDEWEENAFRAKFIGTGIGDLDWPPELDAGITLRTRAWRLRDRAIYKRGGVARTDRVR